MHDFWEQLCIVVPTAASLHILTCTSLPDATLSPVADIKRGKASAIFGHAIDATNERAKLFLLFLRCASRISNQWFLGQLGEVPSEGLGRSDS